MAAEGNSSSRSTPSADSYIGSLISLTSKSEIRYEGVFYDINTEESSIGLRNVRSFGTEGRKKDGQQIPPSDKVYDYILFRGSDIKDLLVKSSPPVQPFPSLNDDPAIIQSHYSHPISTSTSVASAVTGPMTDPGSQSVTAQLGFPGSTSPGGLPLYQPGGNSGFWGVSSPPPSANSSGLQRPMYWQGYYGPPSDPSQFNQQSLLRAPPALSMPPSVQQPMQYHNVNAPLPGVGSNFPEIPSHLFPSSISSLNLTSTSLPSAILASNLPPILSASLASETFLPFIPNRSATSSFPTATLSATLPSPSPLINLRPELNAIVPPISNKASAIPGTLQLLPSNVVTSSSIRTETPTPLLVTPGQLIQSGPTTVVSSQSSQNAHKDVEVVQVSSLTVQALPVAAEGQPPILPLPTPSLPVQKLNEGPVPTRHGYSGRGRGTWSSRAVTKFTEEFDFMAMNEKFNKDEVWGHLGKSKKTQSKDTEGDGNVSGEDDFEDEDAELSKFETKAVYNKDDFFDSLSCNRLHQDSNGRTKFSEQKKIDTETFGDFSRYRGARSGRGYGTGGRSRGPHRWRGYGYVGRGRGRAMPNHTY